MKSQGLFSSIGPMSDRVARVWQSSWGGGLARPTGPGRWLTPAPAEPALFPGGTLQRSGLKRPFESQQGKGLQGELDEPPCSLPAGSGARPGPLGAEAPGLCPAWPLSAPLRPDTGGEFPGPHPARGPRCL